jgi:NAD(P)-dependent dehydrogenase (short-subunit alcohol dehydrogenase family)
MAQNEPQFSDHSRGSVVLVISTSGYFGGTGAAAYISSKHGVTGLLRGSQLAASKAEVRINAIAPNFTATRLTESFSKEWHEAGIDYNTPENVARMIAQMSVDPVRRGECCLVCLPRCSLLAKAQLIVNDRLLVTYCAKWNIQGTLCSQIGSVQIRFNS